METVIAIVVVVVYVGTGVVAIVLRDSFHRAKELVHGLRIRLHNLGWMINGLYILEISIVTEGAGV